MNNQHPDDLTKLERLGALVREDAVEPEALDAAQLEQYLKDHKVDMSEPQRRFATLLKRAKAQQRLEQAAAQRVQAVAKVKEIISSGLDAASELRERVRSMIQKLGQRDPEQAHVYAREFEKATPEDLKVLEEDLMLLELGDDKTDKQDPS